MFVSVYAAKPVSLDTSESSNDRASMLPFGPLPLPFADFSEASRGHIASPEHLANQLISYASNNGSLAHLQHDLQLAYTLLHSRDGHGQHPRRRQRRHSRLLSPRLPGPSVRRWVAASGQGEGGGQLVKGAQQLVGAAGGLRRCLGLHGGSSSMERGSSVGFPASQHILYC